MHRREALSLLGFALAGCGGSGDSQELLPLSPQQDVRFAMGTIAIGTYALTSTDEVARVAATSVGTPIPADLTRMPQIDFSRNALLAVSYGVGGSCFNAEFVSATLKGQTVTIAHRRIELQGGASGAACFGTAAHTIYATVPSRGTRFEFELLTTRFV
jgi:hypothetical protein